MDALTRIQFLLLLFLLPVVQVSSQASGDGFVCDFESDMCGFTNDEGDQSDWVRNQGPTPTMNTGPAVDSTTGTPTGYYAYVSAVEAHTYGRTKMSTKIFASTSNSCLRFMYHMYGNHCGYLIAKVTDVDNDVTTTVWQRWFGWGNQWLQADVNLESLGSYQITFEVYNFMSYNRYEGDIAIDDIRIEAGACRQNLDCNFVDGSMCSFTNDEDNDIDWSSKRANDVTTGPKKDHTFDSENEYFLYMKLTSQTGSGKKGRLLSPKLDSTDVNGHCLHFWYYATGSFGTLTVYVNYSPAFPGEQPYWVLEGPTDEWLRGFVPAISTVNYDIIFEVVSSGNEGTIAIDDIRFTTGHCHIKPSSSVPLPTPAETTPIPPPVPSDNDCDFESTLCTWSQSSTDDFDWVLTRARGNEAHGPDKDHTKGTGDGWYIYVETELQSPGDTAQITSSDITSSDQSCIVFWYHIYGTHVNTLSVYTQETGSEKIDIWRRQGNQINEWIYGYAPINTNSNFKIIFEAECGSGTHGDIALDDVRYIVGDCPTPPGETFACDFEGEGSNAWCGWKIDQPSDIPWKMGTGATREHPDIGPPYDSTTRTENGHYIYVDASEATEGQFAAVITPDLPQWNSKSIRSCLNFYYHHWHDVGTFAIYKEYEYKGVTYRKIYGAATDWTWGNNWVRSGLSINYYDTPNIPNRYIFEIWPSANDMGDMGLDDLFITEGICPGRGTTGFETGMDMWTNTHDDNIDSVDWLLASGDSKWGVSGPSIDHTLGTEKGHYVLFDVSGGSAGVNAHLTNIPFLSTFQCMTFWYHMNGNNIGSLRVLLRHASEESKSDMLLWTLSGQQTDEDTWKKAQVPFYGVIDQAIVFEAIRGSGNQGDIAVDDIALLDDSCEQIIPAAAKPSKNKVNAGVIAGVVVAIIVLIIVIAVFAIKRAEIDIRSKLASVMNYVLFRNEDDTANQGKRLP